MTPRVEFCLLGPLFVRCDGVEVPVPRGRQRAVLAALLLSAGRVVSVDDLTEVLWGAHPPPSARVTVQNTVMRLRQSLSGARSLIRTQPRGYLITVAGCELDVSRFEDRLRDAQAALRDSSWARAADSATAAMTLWRGDPLADAGSELLTAREAPRLAELRLQALEARIDAGLHLGRHKEMISELRRLASAHPLRESLHGLLMVSLYRDDRQGEALAAYASARRILVEELGAEPGPGLRQLHQQILTADPALALPAAAPASGTGQALPHELPAGVGQFTGRTAELAALTRMLDQAPATVVISAISGTAGVGKTALAVHWAHQVASRFADGQLYVNLRGYDPGQPMPAADALAAFLRALGVPGSDIPAEESERSARYRSKLAGKRMLVLLDNARSVDQVRPLLPGTPGSAVLVTSRDALAGLVARDGAARLDLDLLPMADAVALLHALIGQRADADPLAAAELARLCCRLPLALRIAAELAAARADVGLHALVAELADQQQRLDRLDSGGDPFAAVRTVFSWSYRNLDASAARAFRLAGLHPGPHFDAYAGAALTAARLEEARDALETLARAHLVQPVDPGRYQMHDLLRAYAREFAAADDNNAERNALTSLFDYYLHTASIAMDAMFPEAHDRRPRIPQPPTLSPPVTGDAGAARAWLDTERATLIAITAHAAELGWPGHATKLAATLYRYLQTGGHFPEAVIIHGHARNAARQTGDHTAEAQALTGLGAADRRQGRYQQAAQNHRQALTLYREACDPTGQAIALGNLSLVAYYQGSYQQCADHSREALALFRQAGDLSGQAQALSLLGDADSRQGHSEQAALQYQEALAAYRAAGDRTGEARALGCLGVVHQEQGRYQQAGGHFRKALALFRQIGDRPNEAEALLQLGLIEQRQSRHHGATDYLRQALAIHRENGNLSGQAEAHNGLGETFLADRQPERARAEFAVGVGLAGKIGHRNQQARALGGLAHAYRALGDPGQARQHWEQALAIYSDLGVPEAEQIRALLAEASGPQVSRPK